MTQTDISMLPAAAIVNPSDYIEIVQPGNSTFGVSKRAMISQIVAAGYVPTTTQIIAGGGLTGGGPLSGNVVIGMQIIQVAATYGSGTMVPQVTVDVYGRIGAISNVPITGTPPGGAAGGDLSGTYPNPTVARVNGVSYSASPAVGTVPNITGSNVAAYTATPTLGVAGSKLGSITFAGSTSGSTTLQPNVAASGTLTLPAATDTLVGRATTDALTNKSLATFSGALTFNPANFSATLSPTGTGTVTINPATAGAVDNVVIGANTAAAGTFTALTATTVNKVTVTAPAASATLTIANGKTLTVSNTLTFTGTDGSSAAFGAGGTVLYANQPITAADATVPFTISSSSTGPGTILVTSTGTTVTGTNTSFTKSFQVGQQITANGETHTISVVTSDTAMTTDAWTSGFSGAYTLTGAGTLWTFDANGRLRIAGVSSSGAQNLGKIEFSGTWPSSLVSGVNLNWIRNLPTFNQTSGAYGSTATALNVSPSIGATNTQNWTVALGGNAGGLVGMVTGPSIVSGATGTISAIVGVKASVTNGAAGATLTSAAAFQMNPGTNTGTVTNSIGYHSRALTNGTNNIHFLMGTDTVPGANYGIYDATGYNNLFNLSGGTSYFNGGISTSTGNLSIGSAGGTTTLSDATVKLSGISSSTTAQTGTLCWSATSVTYDPSLGCLTSSLRFKKDIVPLTGASELVRRLRPISYRRIDQPDLGEQIWLGAEDVAAIDPRLVAFDPDGKPLGVRQPGIIALLINAVQDQQIITDGLLEKTGVEKGPCVPCAKIRKTLGMDADAPLAESIAGRFGLSGLLKRFGDRRQ